MSNSKLQKFQDILSKKKNPQQKMMEKVIKEHQAKSEARSIASEVIKELDKREAEKASAETIAVVEVPESGPVDYTLPIASAACGFLIGVLITSLCFIIKLNQIRREYERW